MYKNLYVDELQQFKGPAFEWVSEKAEKGPDLTGGKASRDKSFLITQPFTEVLHGTVQKAHLICEKPIGKHISELLFKLCKWI